MRERMGVPLGVTNPLSDSLMKLRVISLMLPLLPLFSAAALAASPFEVYSSKGGFADGWKASAWGGPAVLQVDAEGKRATVLDVNIQNGAQPFSGVILSANPGSGLDLTDKLRENGVVEITFKPGKDAQVQTAKEPQPVQLALTFFNKDGETVHGKFNVKVDISAAEAGNTVKMTLPEALKGLADQDQLASISAVRIQFFGPPVAGFLIVDCVIKE